jgi:hypothetical protein
VAGESQEVRVVLRWVSHVVGSLLAVALLAFGPSCILSPQPDPPGANVVASASDGVNDVAVVGGAGSVPPGADVRVEDDSDSSFAGGTASECGSFVVVLPAGPGDVLRVAYTVWKDGEWLESRSRRIVVDAYDPVPEPTEDADGVSPFTPGAREYAGGFDDALMIAAPVDGQARLWCAGECVQPGVRVVVANQDSAAVTEAVHSGGAFEMLVPATVGDVLLVFAVFTEAPTQTSSIVRLIVPAP